MDARSTTADATTIEREVRIAARPETVFAYFTDPDRMRRWMGRTVDLDPRPGGAFRIDYNGEDIASGTYVEVDPPRRVVFTWGWEAPGDPVPPGASTRRGRPARPTATARSSGSATSGCRPRASRATPSAGTSSCRAWSAAVATRGPAR